jgi:hypothetical protein
MYVRLLESVLHCERICDVLMHLIAEALESDEREHTDRAQSEKPIRDEGATLL